MAARRLRGPGDRGMVTVEFAAALPVFVLMLAVVLCGIRLGIDQLRVQDAARVAARAAARGESAAQIASLVQADAPGASVSISRGSAGGDIVVIVRAPARTPVSWLAGGWSPHARVVAPAEQTP